MSLFDLLFLILALLLIGSLIRVLIAVLRGRTTVARRVFIRILQGTVLYFAILLLVSLVSPRRFERIGADRCSDDWCIAVVSATHGPSEHGTHFELTFRLSSRARGINQRERFVVAYLRDAEGHRFDPEPASSSPPFDVVIGPGDSVRITRTFLVPRDATGLGVVITREGGLNFPRCCIIAEDDSFLHRRPIIRLD
ncbi:MAG: hypothetical protein ABJD11_06375 [Gemmatimonadota bacterium]